MTELPLEQRPGELEATRWLAFLLIVELLCHGAGCSWMGGNCRDNAPRCDGDTLVSCVSHGTVGDMHESEVREDCSVLGNVCRGKNGYSDCVDPALLACADPTDREQCSADGSAIIGCSRLGFFYTVRRCAAAEHCVLYSRSGLVCAEPTGLACTGDSWFCSPERRRLFCSGGWAYSESGSACASGEACVEIEGSTNCVDASLTTCDMSKPYTCSGDRRHFLICTLPYLVTVICPDGTRCSNHGCEPI